MTEPQPADIPVGVEPISWSFGLSMLALACSAVALVLAAAKTPTASAQKALRNVVDVVERWQNEIKLFEATRDRWSTEFSGISERCDEVLDRAESKRRRVAAAESRANAPENSADPPWANMSRAEIIETYRRKRMGTG